MPDPVNKYPTDELLQQIANGDEEAFSTLFHQYRNKIYTIALNITGSAPLSEEILLDVFLKVWLKKHELPRLEHFTAWLFTVTRNHVFSALKQMAVRRNAEDVLRPEGFGEYLLQSGNA